MSLPAIGSGSHLVIVLASTRILDNASLPKCRTAIVIWQQIQSEFERHEFAVKPAAAHTGDVFLSRSGQCEFSRRRAEYHL